MTRDPATSASSTPAAATADSKNVATAADTRALPPSESSAVLAAFAARYPFLTCDYRGAVARRQVQHRRELLAETLNHGNNVLALIPYGKKAFVWLGGEDIFVIEVDNHTKAFGKTVYQVGAMAAAAVAGGCTDSVLFGNLGLQHHPPVFVVEDVVVWRGKRLDGSKNAHDAYAEKFQMKYMVEFFGGGGGVASDFFRVPHMLQLPVSQPRLAEVISKTAYPIHHVEVRRVVPQPQPQTQQTPRRQVERVYLVLDRAAEMAKKKREKKPQQLPPPPLLLRDSKSLTSVFQISADVKSDTYNLIHPSGGLACIPNIATSVMMNSVFRNVRENKNIDYIEESDEEEDFENVNDEKYVDLRKVALFNCELHPVFKHWVPVSHIRDL